MKIKILEILEYFRVIGRITSICFYGVISSFSTDFEFPFLLYIHRLIKQDIENLTDRKNELLFITEGS